MSQDTQSSRQLVQQMLEVAKKVGAGVAAALIVSVVLHLIGVSRGWYFAVSFTFFLVSLIPSWNAIKGPFRFGRGLLFGWGMELYRLLAVGTWLLLVFSLRDGALIAPVLMLACFAFFAGFFRFSRDHFGGAARRA